jgi:hypothetical protein
MRVVPVYSSYERQGSTNKLRSITHVVSSILIVATFIEAFLAFFEEGIFRPI